MKGNIANRATLKVVGDIQEDMKKMASKEDYKIVKDKIENYEVDLTKFKYQNEIHSQILRGYDQVLSQKASKINLLDLEEKTRQSLKRIDVVGIIAEKMNNLEQLVESLKTETEKHFATITKTISVEITGAVKRVVKQ